MYIRSAWTKTAQCDFVWADAREESHRIGLCEKVKLMKQLPPPFTGFQEALPRKIPWQDAHYLVILFRPVNNATFWKCPVFEANKTIRNLSPRFPSQINYKLNQEPHANQDTNLQNYQDASICTLHKVVHNRRQPPAHGVGNQGSSSYKNVDQDDLTPQQLLYALGNFPNKNFGHRFIVGLLTLPFFYRVKPVNSESSTHIPSKTQETLCLLAFRIGLCYFC